MISQIRRAAVSIPTNIAEGAARNSDKELIRFLYISLGSAAEVETLVSISMNLKYLDSPGYKGLSEKIDKLKKMTLGLIKYLKNKKH